MLKRPLSSPDVFNVKNRMKIAVKIILIAPLLIFCKLFYMQTFQHDEFSSKAERAIYNYLAEDRLRGKILDVNGRELAESVRTHSCGVNKRYVKDKNKTVAFLSETLGIPKSRILEKWNRASNFFFVAKKIKPDNYIKISQILRTPLGQGLELTPEYERIHPYGQSVLDIVGAANSKNLGLSGVEKMFNSELSQDISKRRAKRARRGEIIYDRKLKEELSVANVYLTIDEVAQFYAETALKRAVDAVGAEHGIALVQEPKTGKILAAASYPIKDGQSLAFQFTYEPGSTFKAIAVSSAATCPRATHLMHFEPISAAKTVLNIFERPPKQFLLGTGNAFSLCTPCPYKKLFPFLQRITRSDSKIFGFFGFLRQSKVFRTAELPHTAETFLTYSIRYVRKNRVVISLFF